MAAHDRIAPGVLPFFEAAARDAFKAVGGLDNRLVAVTYKRCRRGNGSIDGSYVDIKSFRMYAASIRPRFYPGGNIGRVMPLSIYEPRADLPGTGAITMRFDRAFDASRPIDTEMNGSLAVIGLSMLNAMTDADEVDYGAAPDLPSFYFAWRSGGRPAFPTDCYSSSAWDAARVAIPGGFEAWPAQMFAQGPKEIHPITGRPSPWPDGPPARMPWHAAEDGWCVRDGVPIPRAVRPDAVYANLSHLQGRFVRNPAWLAFQRHRIIPRDGYCRWVASAAGAVTKGGMVSPSFSVGRAIRAGGRAMCDYTETLRRSVLAPAEEFTYGEFLSPALEADLERACKVYGVDPRTGPDADDTITREDLRLVASHPFSPLYLPHAAGIQVIKLKGAPSPETMDFPGCGLYDVGADFARRFDSAAVRSPKCKAENLQVPTS